jgi:hypothetical protein
MGGKNLSASLGRAIINAKTKKDKTEVILTNRLGTRHTSEWGGNKG